MSYDRQVVERVRAALAEVPNVGEKRMFGGITFLVGGHMCCGVVGDELVVRVGPDAHEDALARKHSRPMDFTGRPLRGFVFVARQGFASDADLAGWIERGVAFAGSLPPK